MEEKKESKKLSYEQLENVARQLSSQNRELYARLKMSENIAKRLEYLFKVVEYGRSFNPEFLKSCTEEIEEVLTIPEESEESKEPKK